RKKHATPSRNNCNDDVSPKQQRYARRQNKGEKKLRSSRKKAANISSDVTVWETRLE
ncbi:hypothetical protein ABVT39_010470, partial [Epinephelus coioides]